MRSATYWVEIEDLNRRYEGRYLPTSAFNEPATNFSPLADGKWRMMQTEISSVNCINLGSFIHNTQSVTHFLVDSRQMQQLVF